jgi:SAM-dependent methyltransferase
MDKLLADVARYYDGKIAAHGATPQGVDWKAETGQVLRFAQLARLLPDGGTFKLADIGCGYGALFDYLSPRFPQLTYLGVDVSATMIETAGERHQQHGNVRYRQDSRAGEVVDYSLASGIFNVCQQIKEANWLDYIHATLDEMDATSRRGFAFNCLTVYSDPGRMRPDLYYADPCALFDRCKRRYAKQVALLHDYGLYEFTILIRKE